MGTGIISPRKNFQILLSNIKRKEYHVQNENNKIFPGMQKLLHRYKIIVQDSNLNMFQIFQLVIDVNL